MRKSTAGWMVALLATAVVSPGIAYATAGQIVNISDPSSTASAKVEGNSLRVVDVTPGQQFFAGGTLTTAAPTGIITSAASGGIHITNVNLTVTGTTLPVSVNLQRFTYSAAQSSCGTSYSVYNLMTKWTPVGGQGMVPISYSPALAGLSAKQCLKLTLFQPPAGMSLYWSITGFKTAT